MAKYIEDENGYVTIPDNPITKSGVFQYLGSSISDQLEPNKVYNVYRPEEEVNNPDTIESFRLTPWIPEHIMLGNEFTPAEVVGVQGVTGETVEYRNGILYSKLKLFGEDLKKLIKNGLKELSCGFRCTWDIVSGVAPDGQPYDVIQRKIRGNHLASVESARMGSDIRVAMDRAVFALDSIDYELKPSGENMLTKEMKAAMDEALKPLQTALDEANKEIGELKKKAEDMDKDEDKEKSAEDMEAEKKAKDEEKKKSDAMDSAIAKVESLEKEVESLKSSAMDGNALMKAFTEKQNLASQVSAVVGAFDHSDMDAQGVAKYGLKKMGVACDSGQELAMLKGILHARKTPTFTVDHGTAKDGADNDNSALLAKVGL